MKLVISLMLLAFSQARVIETDCDVVTIHNINHEKQVLLKNINGPYQMTIDYDTNTLFFSYTAEGETNDIFKSGYINLKTNEYNTITGIAGGFASAVDKHSQKVYLGGRDGVYEFNAATHKANHIEKDGKNIWHMFYSDKLYYTDYPNENVYTFKDGVSALLPELQDTKALLIATDGKDNLYFKNSSGLFCYKKAKGETVFLGDYNLNSLTADINNNLYFSTPQGFYNIDENQVVNKLADVSDVYGLVVESDNNLIYSSSNSIIRLTPTKKICITAKNV
uniref:Ommochrome-binding protein-like n=1 Tax=Picea sitchensis TaxID=3332 RepID=A9NPD0_PICSI|nr:unknown [Picea sitchensis]